MHLDIQAVYFPVIPSSTPAQASVIPKAAPVRAPSSVSAQLPATHKLDAAINRFEALHQRYSQLNLFFKPSISIVSLSHLSRLAMLLCRLSTPDKVTSITGFDVEFAILDDEDKSSVIYHLAVSLGQDT